MTLKREQKRKNVVLSNSKASYKGSAHAEVPLWTAAADVMRLHGSMTFHGQNVRVASNGETREDLCAAIGSL